jgi:hypothetical protein
LLGNSSAHLPTRGNRPLWRQQSTKRGAVAEGGLAQYRSQSQSKLPYSLPATSRIFPRFPAIPLSDRSSSDDYSFTSF